MVAVVLFSDVFEYSKRVHGNLPWALGPVCYRIHDVIPVTTVITVTGSLGLFFLLPETVAALEADAVVQKGIQAWHRIYGNAIMVEPLERALSIRQPAAAAIASGHKNIENRSSKIFGVAPPTSASAATGAAVAASSALGLPIPTPMSAASVHAATLDMAAAATTLSARQLTRMRAILGPLGMQTAAAQSVAHVALTMAVTSITGEASDSDMQKVVAVARAQTRRGKKDSQ